MTSTVRVVPSERLSGLAAVWLFGLGIEAIALVIIDGVEGEVGALETGVGAVLLTLPFMLGAYSVYALWAFVSRTLWGLAGVWGLVGSAATVAWWADRSLGTAITFPVLMARSLVLFAPCFLGLVTLGWVVDRCSAARNQGPEPL
jgi:hypothetical protein